MNRSAILVVLGLAVVAAGVVFSVSRTHSEGPGNAAVVAPTAPQMPQQPSQGPVAAPVENERTATDPAGGPAQTPGAADPAPVRRRITLYERDTVRELIKLHVDSGRIGNGEGISSLSEPAWPVDEDSMFLKYGSFDKARTQAELASIQAILDWQSEGPFEDKTLELMPLPLMRAFELEREWLIQRVQDM